MLIDLALKLPETFDIFHLGLAVIAVLLLIVTVLSKGKANSAGQGAADTPTSEPTTQVEPAAAEAEKAVPEISKIKDAEPDSALQLLALLQREARFIDFVQEDLSSFSDEDVGATARIVHQGAKQTLQKYFELEEIRREEEESSLTIEQGFNAQEIKLTGNVSGDAPYRGVLVHRGWRAKDVRLPRTVEGHDSTILAPAEVEL